MLWSNWWSHFFLPFLDSTTKDGKSNKKSIFVLGMNENELIPDNFNFKQKEDRFDKREREREIRQRERERESERKMKGEWEKG